jgi:hypothetical protein
MAGIVRETCESQPQVLVAGPSEDDAAAFAGSVGDRADAGLGRELILGRKRSRTSPSSARIWAALMRPARGTRQLIELGGLVQKAGLVELVSQPAS